MRELLHQFAIALVSAVAQLAICVQLAMSVQLQLSRAPESRASKMESEEFRSGIVRCNLRSDRQSPSLLVLFRRVRLLQVREFRRSRVERQTASTRSR